MKNKSKTLKIKGINLKNRLQGEGIRQEDAAKILNVSRQTLSSWYQKDVLSQDILGNVKTKLNIDLEESGQSLTDHNDSLQKNKPSINNKEIGVPYYDIDFIGGFELVLNDQTIHPTYYIDFLPFNDADFWLNITGGSMSPKISHGDIVALKVVERWQEFLLEGEIYAIVTNNGFRTIKILAKGKDEDHYTLISYNKSEEYKPQSIPKKMITHVFRVKGSMKIFF